MRLVATLLLTALFYTYALAQSQSTLADPIAFYRKAISPLRGAPCAMYPSCSQYGEQCFEQYNFLQAASLTADRLLRCGHAHSKYPWYTPSDGFARLIDPPPGKLFPFHMANWPDRPFFATAKRKRTPENLIAHLINQGMHAQALAEFERLAFLHPEQLTHLGYANALQCYMALQRADDGIAFYHSRIPPHVQTQTKVATQLAKLYIIAENYPLALARIERAMQDAMPIAYKRNLHTVKALCYLPLHEPKEANYRLAANELGMAKRYAQDSTAQSNSLELIYQMATFLPKHPTLAATLSIVPGLGYMYLGHWATGITSLVLNGALALATYQAAKSQQWALAGIIGMLNFSFYIGGIQGAYRRANLDAKTHYQTFVYKLRYINNFQNL